MSETDLSRSAQDALTAAGFHVTRVQAGKVKVRGGWMILAEAGTPDLLVGGIVPASRNASVMGWLEVKRPKGPMRESQKKWHAKAEKRGELVAVFRSASEAVEIAMAWRRGFGR